MDLRKAKISALYQRLKIISGQMKKLLNQRAGLVSGKKDEQKLNQIRQKIKQL